MTRFLFEKHYSCRHAPPNVKSANASMQNRNFKNDASTNVARGLLYLPHKNTLFLFWFFLVGWLFKATRKTPTEELEADVFEKHS